MHVMFLKWINIGILHRHAWRIKIEIGYGGWRVIRIPFIGEFFRGETSDSWDFQPWRELEAIRIEEERRRAEWERKLMEEELLYGNA